MLGISFFALIVMQQKMSDFFFATCGQNHQCEVIYLPYAFMGAYLFTKYI